MTFESIGVGLDIISKFISLLNVLKWRNKEVVYIHSNKKLLDFDVLRQEKINMHDSKIINHQYISKNPQKFSKYHFWKQRMHIYQINHNKTSNAIIAYSGFVSTPLAIYDGYMLRDTKLYKFVDINKENFHSYSCEFNNKIIKESYLHPRLNNSSEVSLIIASSKDINTSKLPNIPKIIFNDKQEKVDSKYLVKVYNYVYNFLEFCNKNNVTKVHLFVAAKQPVSFVIGLAIQPYHPAVIAYEYVNGEYVWGLNIKNRKVIKYGIRNSK